VSQTEWHLDDSYQYRIQSAKGCTNERAMIKLPNIYQSDFHMIFRLQSLQTEGNRRKEEQFSGNIAPCISHIAQINVNKSCWKDLPP
jgi:hypothetical protein